nr:hypothetical protein Itr_chr03CG07750 [Ipomoea trifida]
MWAESAAVAVSLLCCRRACGRRSPSANKPECSPLLRSWKQTKVVWWWLCGEARRCAPFPVHRAEVAVDLRPFFRWAAIGSWATTSTTAVGSDDGKA